MNIFIGQAAPHFRQNQNHAECQNDHAHTHKQRPGGVLGFSKDGSPPFLKIGRTLIEHYDFLAEWKDDGGELAELFGQLLILLRTCGSALPGFGLIGKAAALLDGGYQ